MELLIIFIILRIYINIFQMDINRIIFFTIHHVMFIMGLLIQLILIYNNYLGLLTIFIHLFLILPLIMHKLSINLKNKLRFIMYLNFNLIQQQDKKRFLIILKFVLHQYNWHNYPTSYHFIPQFTSPRLLLLYQLWHIVI